MRRNAQCFIAVLILAILTVSAQTAQALQVLSPAEGESVFVNISKKELNMIQFPFNGIRAYTSSRAIEVVVRDRQVLVTMTEKGETKPQEVFFSTPYGTYLLMLVPKDVPAETIMMRIDKADTAEADDWERDNDYVKRLKDLIKALHMGSPPNGYALNTDKVNASRWECIEQTRVLAMTGANLVGEVYDLVNHGTAPVRLSESEFYDKGVLAVSLSSQDLHIGAKEQVMVVRRKTVSSRAQEVKQSDKQSTTAENISNGENNIP